MSSESAGQTLGSMASSITGSFTNITKLITSGSYLAGLGFSIASITKFKAHKDNPTQVPIGAPSALVAVSAILMYLPSIEAQAAAAGVTASEVKAAAEQAGITQAEVEAKASAAGFTSAQISAAESALKTKK